LCPFWLFWGGMMLWQLWVGAAGFSVRWAG
jgi:hypothetical protein